jgi:flagellar hook-basal body complex protein FliE
VIGAISAAVHALGAQAQIAPVRSAAPADATGAAGAAQSTSFSSQLTSAIGALDKSQNVASTDAQGLATGTISDPTQAVTAVENATLAMDMASQIQSKLVTAANTLFATQM